jgi:hypothetical protein
LASRDDEKTLLEYQINLNPGQTAKQIKKFGDDFQKRMKTSERAVTRVERGMFKFYKQIDASRKAGKGIKKMQTQYAALNSSIEKAADTLNKLYEKRDQKAAGSKERENIEKQIKAVEKENRIRTRTRHAVGKNLEKSGGLRFDEKELSRAAEEAGEALTEPLRALMSKDAPALFRRASKLLASPFTATGVAGKALVAFGEGGGMKGWKERKEAARKEKEDHKKSLANAGAAGAGMKEMGGVFKMLGSTLQVVGKLGPAISILSSFMMGFVKVLIDSEASVSDFNKQILATSGTGTYLSKGFKNAATGATLLEDALSDARKGVDDLSNVQWGISRDASAAFQASLGAEGVSLDKLSESTKVATGYAKDHAKVIQMGVAYSRSFGVSLNEISQFQGEMMADMGAGLDQVQASFQRIQESAEEAGMASNKFFNIIRSFSADLTLFTLRMEEVTQTLKILGKTMDPRSAQKLLQGLTKAYTSGYQENLKHLVLAGDKNSRRRGDSELNKKLASLLPQIANALDDKSGDITKQLEAILRNPNRGRNELGDFFANAGKELGGPIREQIVEAMTFADQQRTLAGRAMNQTNYGPMSKILHQMNEMSSILSKSNLTLDDLNHLTTEQTTALLGNGNMTEEELHRNQKLLQSLITYQREMVGKVKSGLALSPEVVHTLENLGVKNLKTRTVKDQKTGKDVTETYGDADTVKSLEAIYAGDKTMEKTMDSMDESTADLMSASQKAIDFQADTAHFQVSLMDKMDIIGNILQDKIFDILTTIWKSMVSGFARILKDEDYKEQQALVAAARSKNKDISGAFQHSKNMTQGKTEMIEGVGKIIKKQRETAAIELAENQKKLKTEKDPEAKKKLEERNAQLIDALRSTSEAGGDLYKQSNEQGIDTVITLLADAAAALKKANIAEPKNKTEILAKAAEVGASKGKEAEEKRKGIDQAAATAAAVHAQGRASTQAVARGEITAPVPIPASVAGSQVTDVRGPIATPPPAQGRAATQASAAARAATASSSTNVTVQLEMKGDVNRLVNARVVEGVAQYDRNRRLR